MGSGIVGHQLGAEVSLASADGQVEVGMPQLLPSAMMNAAATGHVIQDFARSFAVSEVSLCDGAMTANS